MFFFFFFDQHKDELNAALQIPEIEYVAELKDFYFQKAADKFADLQEFEATDIVLSNLINAVRQKPFSFERLLSSYNENSTEYKLLLLIGQVISYFDTNAAMKNTLNEYEDKRAIALAYVRQNYWVESLLKFKSGTDIYSLPENVRNMILYIQDPANNISIVSEKRRKVILETLFGDRSGNLFDGMKEIGITAANPLNNGYLYSMILHSASIRKLWDNPTEKTAYWLGGAYCKPVDLSEKFIKEGIYGFDFEHEKGDISDIISDSAKLRDWISGIFKSNSKKTFELFVQMKAGDRIAIKKSIYGKGIPQKIEIKAIRGRVDIGNSLRKLSLQNAKVICDFDEFSGNIYHGFSRNQ